jgi:NAD(P)-dependent dehydrogenase (short-subunit alcohol dehydrogenase family)
VCKQPYTRLHTFYHALCTSCGDFNLAKRSQSANLTGRVALVTGGRIRIGFQTALKLLRAGATVVVTTRFPCDAAQRYARESDFDSWRDRLRIHGLDLRHLPALQRFTDELNATQTRLDVLVNNAAQTVRRPPAFYQHLLDGEAEGLAALPPGVRGLLAPASPEDAGAALDLYRRELPLSAALTQLPLLPEDAEHDPQLFPPGEHDADGQQLDRRPRNSWTLLPGEVSSWELVEVHLINALAPFLLLTRLEPLLRAGAAGGEGSYVVNVSATEGQFAVAVKAGTHPHTSMAKASMNMITRACAAGYAAQGIYVNSVDTGWVSLQQTHEGARALEEAGVRPPLDEVDGAARICDPVFTGVNGGDRAHGRFFKDYREAPW